MGFFYSLTLNVAKCVAPVVARGTKAKKFVEGRKAIWTALQAIPKNAKVVWMHCASLGEYEQGLPVLQELKKTHPDNFYLVTFFSPSGYEVRKNHGVANLTSYLPWDTPKDIKRFIAAVRPSIALLVKYEFWPNLIREIQHQKIPLFLIAGLFRKQQIFFKPWGNGYRKLLHGFNHVFVQNDESLRLLHKIGIEQASISGDTRFDRVGAAKAPLAFMESFCNGRKCIIAGSTWPEDEAVLRDAITQTPNDWCWLIAPHEIHEDKLEKLMQKLPKGSLRYTQNEVPEFVKCPVLVLDTVGMLSQCYAYAAIAYVGGAMGNSGLHNILEPAAEGIPIVIGKNYCKFPEAKALIELGGVVPITSAKECIQKLLEVMQNEEIRQQKGNINRTFVIQNQGATQHTLTQLEQQL